MFELIHSDLKSFPIESYHCHKYIITFVEDFTSIAWTIPLHSKDAALVLTRHFLKMVSTQFNAKVQGWMSDAGGEHKFKAFDNLLKGEGICIFKVPPILLNKMVMLNVSCALLWTNQKLCGMKPAFLIIGGNSQLHMPCMFTITHPYNVTTGVHPMRCCTSSNQI